MLLNYSQFQDMNGRADENDFNQLEPVTEDLFNSITRMFYVVNDIDKDPDFLRVKYFRKAMELQIDFMNDIGAKNVYDISSKSIRSVSVDGTSVTTSGTPADSASHGLYYLAKWWLAQTGLLFKGVPII